MGLNRKLVETVKGHFAQKSTAELQDIARVRDLERWSEEAFAAAEEVLADRAAGRAKEPRVPVKDTPPPSPGESLRELVPVLGFLAGGLFGGMLGRALVRAADEIPNRPVAFGSDLAWLAVETNDTRAVAVALGLHRV